ncbi:dihydropteroate synthase [Candidatus Magnetaquiglobus chichijimensis]|uniref:dihydropteroate synthase n=1 Tax=Candidatus Magnetaquiglobus chichijimensis TaxID=3141448 RepID=UPI003B96BECB
MAAPMRVLLEPMLGDGSWFAGRHGDPVPLVELLDDPITVWLVTLAGWREGWDRLLPEGMRIREAGLWRLAEGRLNGAGLRGLTEVLRAVGLEAEATAIEIALARHRQADPVWHWGGSPGWRVDLTGPRVMGIVNVTPDSFSGDGLAGRVEAAIAHGVAMAEAGADLLDVGGESTRPGSLPVSLDAELERVVPVVAGLARVVSIPVAVDSSKPEVMRAALQAGAAMINDVTALRGPGLDDEEDAGWLAGADVPVLLMHMADRPEVMQSAPRYDDVVVEVFDFLARRQVLAERCGIRLLACDPGIGFGKSREHNLALLRRRRVFRGLGVPLMLGFSRKRVLGELSGIEGPMARDGVGHLLSLLADAAILRVHDVAGAKMAMRVAAGMRR